MAQAIAQSSRPTAWIISPAIDLALLVATPLAIVPLVSLAASSFSPELIFLVVVSFASIGHHLPGFMRAYGDAQLFQRFRWRFLLAPPLLLIVTLLFTWQELHGLELVLLFWATWHIMMQTYGFMRIYDMKRGIRDATTAWLDFLLCGAVFVAGVVFSDARVYGMVEVFWQTGVPLPSPQWLWAIRLTVGLATGAIAIVFVAHTLRTGSVWGISWVKILLLLATAWLFWVCGSLSTNLLIGVAMFEIFHALQYYAIVWAYNRRLAERVGPRFGPLRFLFQDRWYFLCIYVAAIAAFGAIRFFSDGIGSLAIQKILLAVLTTSTILHFYYDGFIWKVSERKTQENLDIDGGRDRVGFTSGLAHAGKWAILGIFVCVLLGAEWTRPPDSARDQRRMLQQLIAWTPNLPELQARLSRDVLARGDKQRAAQIGQQAVAMRPFSHHARAALGTALLETGQFDQAVVHLTKAAELAPGEWQNHYDLAQALAQLGRTAKAEASFARAAQLAPQNESIHIAWADMLTQCNRHQQALAHYRRATQVAPASAQAFPALVAALVNGGHVEEAIAQGRQAVADEPDSAAAHLALGKALIADGQYRQAALWLRKSIALDGTSVDACYQLGLARLHLKQWELAHDDFVHVLKLANDNAMAHLQLGNVYFMTDQLQRAERSYRRCTELAPESADAQNNLGAALFELDQLSDAAAAYRRAIELSPQNANGHYNLGLILLRTGNAKQAGQHIQRAAELGQPATPDVKQALGWK